MADTVHIIKPEYMARARALHIEMNNQFSRADRADAMARHPASRESRKKVLRQEALNHTERAHQAGTQIMSLGTSFSRRGEFHSAKNAQYN